MFTKALSIAFVSIGATLFCACSPEEDDPPPAPQCDTNYASFTTGAPTRSFKDDVLPIFSLACTASACHNVNDSNAKADLVLGVKGTYSAGTGNWDWSFPTTGGSDPVKDPQPLTQTVIDTVYADLLLSSKTVPSVMRVVPGDPAASFLLDKMADIQNSQPYVSECVNQDPTKSLQGPCGDKMPQTGAGALCVTSPDRFQAVVQWVQQGALNN